MSFWNLLVCHFPFKSVKSSFRNIFQTWMETKLSSQKSKVEQINYCFVFLDFLRKKVTSFSFDCLSFFCFLFESDKFLTNEVVISRLTAFVFSHLCSFVSLLVCSFVHLFLSISVLYYCYCYCCCVIIIWKTEGNLFFIKNECEYVFLGSVALF